MPLAGLRVLLVEDEPIIALAIEDMLTSLGCTVVGPVLRLGEAEAVARTDRLDAAILDVNLGEGPSFSVSAILRSRSIPFCFSTGYGSAGIAPEYAAVPVLQKPYRQNALQEMLVRCLGSGAFS
jgi:CheY-like chemotaxis protein